MNIKSLMVIITGILILITLFIDILALTIWGVDATISSILNVWAFQAHPLLVFIAGMAAGGLVVHFFGWRPN